MPFNTGGALGGAASGASLGSFAGLPGAAIGGLAGLLFGGFGGGGGRPDKLKTFNRLTPQQQQLQQQILESLMSGQGQFGDLFGQFNPQQATNAFQQGVANPALRNFNQNIVPGIQERFADQGYSSALTNSLASAGRDLQESLNNQLSPFIYQAMMQNQQNRLQGINQGLGTQNYTPYIQQGSPGAFNGLMEGVSGGLGQAGASNLMNLFGTNGGWGNFGIGTGMNKPNAARSLGGFGAMNINAGTPGR